MASDSTGQEFEKAPAVANLELAVEPYIRPFDPMRFSFCALGSPNQALATEGGEPDALDGRTAPVRIAETRSKPVAVDVLPGHLCCWILPEAGCEKGIYLGTFPMTTAFRGQAYDGASSEIEAHQSSWG